MKKALNGLLAAGVIAVLFAAMLLAIRNPKATNYYENRPAAALPVFSWDAALRGSFQNDLETALHDQLPAAQGLEKLYHETANALILRSTTAQTESRPDAYYGFRDLLLFHGDVVYEPVFPADRMDQITAQTDRLNALFDAHPELRFYVYYIEKDTDVVLPEDLPTGFSDAVLSGLKLPQTQKAVFPVRSYEDFHSQFFKTDHHWNCYGSYAGYLQVLSLLGKDSPIRPEGVELVADDFCGSKAISSGTSGLFSEPFYAQRYTFPAMTVTVNGQPEDYGLQGQPWDAEKNGEITYGGYYGYDCGEVIFRTENTGAGNLLVIGESFDNAILKLLASHFESLCAVDLRAYETDLGKPFRFSEYCAAHGIDTVLFIGNMDFFLMDIFCPED